MKIALCIINHEPDKWFFSQLASQCHQISKIEYIHSKDLEIPNTFWNLCLLKLADFFSPLRKHQPKSDETLSYLFKRLEVTLAHPIKSTLSGNVRLKEILLLHRKIKKEKTNTASFRQALKIMKKFDALFIYNGILPQQKHLITAAKLLNKKIFFFEVGPLPNTIIMDETGINYSSSVPRQISFYKNWQLNNPNPAVDFKKLTPALKTTTRKTIYPKPFQTEIRDLSQKYIFFPLQVYHDTQILFHHAWIKNISHLIDIVRRATRYLPQGWRVLAKEHPQCTQRYQVGAMEDDNFLFANGNPTPDLIKNASLIVTLNSSVGLEAMLFDKPVVTLGQAFYAFDGLTQQCNSAEDVFEVFKNPEQVSFNPKDRRAFLSWLANDYYLDGSFFTKTFSMNDKNKRLISRILQAKSNG